MFQELVLLSWQGCDLLKWCFCVLSLIISLQEFCIMPAILKNLFLVHLLSTGTKHIQKKCVRHGSFAKTWCILPTHAVSKHNCFTLTPNNTFLFGCLYSKRKDLPAIEKTSMLFSWTGSCIGFPFTTVSFSLRFCKKNYKFVDYLMEYQRLTLWENYLWVC